MHDLLLGTRRQETTVFAWNYEIKIDTSIKGELESCNIHFELPKRLRNLVLQRNLEWTPAELAALKND
jgi:hypothetical protein